MRQSILKFGILLFLLSFAGVSVAEEETIEFFSSNNTHEITPKAAFQRLVGNEQRQLKDTISNVLQANHVNEVEYNDSLGAYQMADKNLTGDNTEIFYISPLQTLTSDQAFSLAAKLSDTLKQESVAVFIPSDQAPVAHVVVVFESKKPTINDAIKLIREKLPAQYSQAFSLHLNDQQAGYSHAKVAQVEWLGSKVNLNDIKSAFPDETILFHKGHAYLVYKTGKTQEI